jgi:hypothetical protein
VGVSFSIFIGGGRYKERVKEGDCGRNMYLCMKRGK